MNREKRNGIVIMAVGLLIPVISLFFCSGYKADQNLIKNIYSLAIPLETGSPMKEAVQAKDGQKGKVTWNTIRGMIPRSIAFRFILAFGVFLIFLGFIRLDSARQKTRTGSGGEGSRGP